tara:strand:+ start:2394 stop:2996 length:603 start_codon:yes stop_codon:yes gene_type:complete
MLHKFEIPKEIYKELLKIVEDKSIKANKTLIGNIREEYSLNKHMKYFENFILSKIGESDFLVNYLNNLKIFDPNPQKLVLSSMWVNYQKKYEFNPVHTHGGVFSFIMFVKIPFTIEEEKNKSPGIESIRNLSGHLSFLYIDPNAVGQIGLHDIPVDKTWEETGFIFKSSLNHMVYPFFSEGERITVSGNISFDNKELNKR